MHEHLICGICHSHHLLQIAATPSEHSHLVVGKGVMRTVRIDRYVCTDCGHVEQWVNSKDDLKELRTERQDL